MVPEVSKSSTLVPLNRHQVFTGAANPGDNCYSVGCLNTTAFVVYGSGTNLVILDCGLETLQIIPGSKYGNIQVECVECSSSEGMIAASYAHHIYLFKPRSTDGSTIVSINKSESVRWHEIGFFQLESFVTSLSWNPDGSQLLTAAAERIQLWKASSVDSQTDWFCSWQYKSPNAIKLIKFSPNGQYFATIGNNDSFVKIWYKQLYQITADNKDQRCMQASTSSTAIYNYVYISHPCTVTGFSWRATSHLMPKSSVLSYLLTSCRDNKCRIWAETSDSLRRHHISLTLNCNINNAALIQTTTENDLVKDQTTSTTTTAGQTTGSTVTSSSTGATNEDSDSFDEIENDTAEEERQQLEMAYGNPNRFHLVSVINPQADIPTSVGSVLNGTIPDSTQFVVHWLNNKYFHFNLQAEIIFRHLRQKLSRITSDTPTREGSESSLQKTISTTKPDVTEKDGELGDRLDASSGFDTAVAEQDKENANSKLQTESIELSPDSIDGFSEVLRKSMPHWLKEWNSSNDVIFAIHPLDGSLLVWKVESLDEHWKGRYKHPQISFASRIPNAFPASDAISCSNKLLMYRNVLSNDIEKFLKLKFEHQMSNPFILTNKNYASGLFAPNVIVLSKHSDGSLNQWEVTFDALSKYNSLQTVSHQCRVSGHRFQMIDVQNHPSLPLLLTVSHHNVPKMKITNVKTRSSKNLIAQMSVLESNLEEPAIERPGVITEDLSAPHGLCSELILWRLDPVGPLSNQSGGLLELARVQSPQISAFCNTCWIPTLLPNNTLGPVSKSPSVCFVAFDGNCLRVYQSVIEAQSLLTEMAVLKGSPLRRRRELTKLNIVSQQSTNQPACIIQLEEIANSKFLQNSVVKLFHVFKLNDVTSDEISTDLHTPDNFSDSIFDETFVLVTIAKSIEDANSSWNIHTWVLRMSFDSSNLPMFHVNMSHIPEETAVDLQRCSPKKRNSTEIRNLLTVSSTYKGSQKLPLDGANIESACVAEPEGVSKLVKHPLSRTDALYQIITATSDNRVHFWQCSLPPNNESFIWKKWTSIHSRANENSLSLPYMPVGVTCANFGRIALSYKIPDLKKETVTVRVDIYENESSGGAAWTLEDTVVNTGVKPPSYVHGATIEELKAGTSRHGSILPPSACHSAMNGVPNKPPTFGRISSFYRKTSTGKKPFSNTLNEKDRQSKASPGGGTQVKKVYLDLQESDTAPAKEYVHLSWVPKYDSSYLLCVCTGETVFVYASQTTSISVASSNPKSAIAAKNTELVQKPGIAGESCSRKWVPIAFVKISTSDQLSPFPLLMTCAANGILILGLMNEMQIYSQWQSKKKVADSLFGSGSAALGKPKKGTLTDISKCLSDTKNPLHKMRKSHDSSSLQSADASSKGSMNSLNSLVSQVATDKSADNSKIESETGTAVSLRDFIDPGIFEESRSLTPMLPQYHPKQLIGLLNFGKTSRVKAILAHLVKTIVGEEAVVKAIIRGDLEEDEKHDAMRTRRATLSRSMTIQKKATTSFSASDINMSQIDSIPPLPLHSLVEMDSMSVSTANPLLNIAGGKSDSRGKNVSDNADAMDPDDKYASLFGFNEEKTVDSMLQLDIDFLDESGAEKSRENGPLSPKPEEISVAVKSIGPTYFGAAQSRLLSQCLTKVQLPDLTRTEQMHLLAIAEVVSTISTESSDFAQGADSSMTKDTIDACGMKFVMGLKLHQYILRASGQSFASPAQQVLDPKWFAWAHLSESEDQMLAALRPNAKWPELRNVGVGWWVTNLNILRRLIERVAREHFQFKKEPMDAAIFYIAMQKKHVLRGLFKSVGDERMTNFFSKDFSTAENKRIALKNAFALNSKLRFEHAAAFFLLAGALDDAVQVCVKKLHDIQLAIVISRLYEEQLDFSQKAQEILQQHVINPVNGVVSDAGGQNLRSVKSSNPETGYPSNHNPFLRCIANWWLKNYSHALIALIEACSTDESQNISVFNFYNYLRRHPMILRRHILKIEQMNDMSIAGQSVFLAHMTGVHDAKGEQMLSLNEVTKEERLLFFKTAAAHFTNGCPLLALEVLTILPPVRKDDLDLNSALDVNQISIKRKPLRTGTIDEPAYENTNGFDGLGNQGSQQAKKPLTDTGMFDWGAPVEMNGGGLDLNFDVDLGDVLTPSLDLDLDDESPTLKKESIEPVKSLPETENKAVALSGSEAAKDIFAVYLKQSACLKIFVEELRTLAISFDCEESHLRGYFRLWLEKVVNLLHILCYDRESVDQFHETDPRTISPGSGSNIFVFESDESLEKSESRKCWLKRNEQLLRIFLSYSALYGCNGGGLSAIRMELVQLLQELQQNYSRKQLSSTLPFPVALPLISACLAPVQTVVVNPFNYLEKFCKDLAKSLTSYTSPPQSTNSLRVAITLRNLCGALSSCIYQSLQDSNKVTLEEENETESNARYTNSVSSPRKVGQLLTNNPDASPFDKTSILLASRRHRAESMHSQIISKACDWPGVKLILRLLSEHAQARNLSSEDKLKVLLIESCCVVYIGVLFHALVTADPNEMLRIVAHPLNIGMFPLVAGGCVRRRSPQAGVAGLPPQDAVNVNPESDQAARAESAAHVAANKHRIALNMKLFNESSSPLIAHEEQQYQFEKFSSPKLTLIDYFLSKPQLPSSMDFISYDSDDEIDLGDVEVDDSFYSDDDISGSEFKSSMRASWKEENTNTEHSDLNSYSWCLMRYAIITFVLDTMNSFLVDMGLELSELALQSPTLQNLRNTICQWQNVAHTQLSLFANSCPPEDYIPRNTDNDVNDLLHSSQLPQLAATGGGSFNAPAATGSTFGGAVHNRPVANDLFHADAHPFRSSHHTVRPVQRLWCYLVRQKRLENIFFYYCFPRRGDRSAMLTNSSQTSSTNKSGTMMPSSADASSYFSSDFIDSHGSELPENPVTVIYKDPGNEVINAICFNNIPLTVSHSIHCLVSATPKDVTESDITDIVSPAAPSADARVLQGKRNSHPHYMPHLSLLHRHQRGHSEPTQPSSHYHQTPVNFLGVQKDSVLRRKYATHVRKLSSHPYLPFYLTGCSYGKVNLWEWGLEQVVAMFKTSNQKVTGLSFNDYGNKLGVCHETGNLHIYHTCFGSINQTFQNPFLSLECHSKNCSGFAFIGCSSLVATVGSGLGSSSSGHVSYSSVGSSLNSICLWDTLMPPKRHGNLISVYHGGEAGSEGYSCVAYSPSNQSVVAGTARGEVVLYDVRQRSVQATLSAFTSTQSQVKSIALDPLGNLLTVGSRDGDIKAFDLSTSDVIFASEGEHKRRDAIFKTGSRGVLDMQVLSSGDHLISCGSDGSVKLRKLTKWATSSTQFLV